MKNRRISEKILKHNLKNKRSITLSLIVSFLITGGLGFFEDDKIYARDLRVRNSGGNDIRPDSGGPNLSKSINDTDVINIVNPNSGGISHNKFIDFSVGTDGVIFNNNSTGSPTVTKIGGIVTQNPNLTTSASTILSEVTGNRGSSINGVVEIAGQRADFILANENGISVNGGGFINTNGVTLTTGRPTVSGSNIDLSVQNGNVTIDGKGVGTAGNYFNIIAKTIELKGQIAPFDGERDADINLIAGQNRVSIADRSSPIVKEIKGNDKGDKQYGIYANHLGAMYGKNIKLISTTQGLGVKHEGLVKSTGDINISSNGDIVVGALLSEKNVNIEAKGNFNTINGSFKNSGIESNFSITAGDGVNLEVTGDIVIESVIQAEKTGIKIVGKNLTMKTQTTAKILSQKGLTIKLAGNMNVEELLVPVMVGRDPKLPSLVVLNENGKVIVKDPVTGRIIQANELTWETTGIFGENINIEAGNLINNALIQTGTKDSKNTINIKVANQLTNKKIISSSGNLNIDSNRLQNESGAVIKGGTVKIVS
ncbi:MAG: filamentous hemagglutinin N-terminal domain-containing protein, partial [Cetobacterium sp.]